MARKKPLIKGREKEIDSGLKSGRRKIGSNPKNKENKTPKDNPLLSQPPGSSSTMKWFMTQNEGHKRAAPKIKKDVRQFEDLKDEDFFHDSSRFISKFRR